MPQDEGRPHVPDLGRRDMAWQDDGLCGSFYAETGADLWFGPDASDMKYVKPGHETNIAKLFQAAGKRVCWHCPVRQECLTFAFKTESDEYRHGVWGGLGTYERTQLKNRVLAERGRKVA
jgi:hypothetical protein